MGNIYRTKDCPTANDRKPKIGDVQYTLTFPLEDGSFLKVLCGKEGMKNLRNVVLEELCDDDSVGGN